MYKIVCEFHKCTCINIAIFSLQCSMYQINLVLDEHLFICKRKKWKTSCGCSFMRDQFFFSKLFKTVLLKNNHLHRYHHGTWNVICIHLGILLNNDQHLSHLLFMFSLHFDAYLYQMLRKINNYPLIHSLYITIRSRTAWQ